MALRLPRLALGCCLALVHVGTAAGLTPSLVRYLIPSVGAHPAASIVDLDADGDVDVLVGDQQGHLRFVENVGTASVARFGAPVADPFGLADVGDEAIPSLADIDADGDLDAFVGTAAGDTLFFANVGTASAPAFAAPTTTPFGLASVGANASPTLVDIDADGDLDAFIGETSGNVLFFANVGTAAAPAFAAPVINPFGLQDVVTVGTGRVVSSFADVDADGDLDAYLLGYFSNTAFFENVGTASAPAFAAPDYTSPTATGLGSGPWGVMSFADLDADGDLDGVTSDGGGNLQRVENLGSAAVPIFGTAWRNPFGLVSGAGDPIFVDIDADGDLDVFSWYLNAPRYFENVGTAAHPTFAAPVAYPFGLFTAARAPATFADVDGDGDLDAFIGRYLDGATDYFENVGTASSPAFGAAVTNPFGLTAVAPFGVMARSPVFADIDGDGDQDAFIGDYYGYVQFFENTGTATAPAFAASVASAFGLPRIEDGDLSFADLDGDGDQDAFIGDHDGYTRFCANTGTSTAPVFAAPVTNPFGLNLGDGVFGAPRFADIDADGDLDGFIGNSLTGRDVFFFYNIGSPTAPRFPVPSANPFGLAATTISTGDSDSIALADIDADGDLDAFVGSARGPLRFFENTGSAAASSFALPYADPFGYAYFGDLGAPTFVDIDDDGDLDAFLWDGGYHETIFFLNNGTPSAPHFAPWQTEGPLSGGSYSGTAAFADIDADGDLDVFMRQTPSSALLFFENVGTRKARSFAAPVANPFGLTAIPGRDRVTLFDIDADGDLDLFGVATSGDSTFFPNVGTASAPAFGAPVTNHFGLGRVDFAQAPVFADIDADGDADAFVGGYTGLHFFEGQVAGPGDLHCPPTPAACSVAATRASLRIDETVAGKERLVADLRTPKGWQQLFGDPLKFAGTAYAVCIYSPSALVAELRVDRAGSLCAGRPCWQVKASARTLYAYLDPQRAAAGTRTIKITQSSSEDRIKWRGDNRASSGQNALPTGLVAALPSTSGSTSVLQLFASDAGPCKTATLRTQPDKPGRYRGIAP